MNELLPAVGVIVVGVVFLSAAVRKTMEPSGIVATLRFLGVRRVMLARVTVVSGEVALGIGLCIGWKLSFLVPGAAILLLGFTSGLLMLRFVGFKGDCGCFGSGAVDWMPPEFRNIGLILLLLPAMRKLGLTATAAEGEIWRFFGILAGAVGVAFAIMMEWKARVILEQKWEVKR